MKTADYFNVKLLGLIGAILIVISEFSPWFSSLTLLDIFLITMSIAIDDSYIYLFPIIGGIICIFGSGLIMYNEELKINSVIINSVGLGFLLLFLFFIISYELVYLTGLGFYICITGFFLVIFGILNVLSTNEPNEEGNRPLARK